MISSSDNSEMIINFLYIEVCDAAHVAAVAVKRFPSKWTMNLTHLAIKLTTSEATAVEVACLGAM